MNYEVTESSFVELYERLMEMLFVNRTTVDNCLCVYLSIYKDYKPLCVLVYL